MGINICVKSEKKWVLGAKAGVAEQLVISSAPSELTH